MNWKRAMIGVAIAAPMVGLLAYGMTRNPRDIPSPLPGRPAPDFALEVFAPGQGTIARTIGDTIRLSQHRGDVVVLNFWASWCLACRDEHEALSHVAERYAGKDVHFVGVLYNDLTGAGTNWIAQMGGQSYPSVLDPRTRTAIDYGLYGVPETFFIGRDGRVGYKHVGPVTEALLAYKIDSLLSVPVEP
jgi:cytochrome c biogenesis protein CcmG, thiol:disulfide interchange protein DsbE